MFGGRSLSRDEIVSLLGVEAGSADGEYLRAAAREAAAKITGGRGYIWCAVGMDYAPCSMNCKFCSFGEKWGIVREPRHVELRRFSATCASTRRTARLI